MPRAAQGFLHSVAYGIAILLGLTLFIGYRSFPGLKYTWPKSRRDLWLTLAGFALLAPVLIVIGIPIGFLPPPHLPTRSAGAMAGAFGIIFAGTALPEEILFRSLIQNLLMLRFGATTRTLLLAAFIFGCAHLDNGPQPVPNWRYMILATIAGVAYGKVFQRASTHLLFGRAAHAGGLDQALLLLRLRCDWPSWSRFRIRHDHGLYLGTASAAAGCGDDGGSISTESAANSAYRTIGLCANCPAAG